MTPVKWDNAVREALWRSLLFNSSVFQPMGFCVLQLTANHGPEQTAVLPIQPLPDCTENTTPNNSSVVSLLYLCLCVCMCIAPITARQKLCKHTPMALDTQATTNGLSKAPFSMQFLLHQRKLND